jgi:hypothetical protein
LKTSCLCRASTAPAAPCPLAPAESPTLAPKISPTAETMATTKVPVVLLVYARAASFVPAKKKWKNNSASGTISQRPSSKFRPCAGAKTKKPRQPSPTLFSFIFLYFMLFCLRRFSRHAICTLVSFHCARSEPFYPYHIHTNYTHTHTRALTRARTHTHIHTK